MTEPAGPLKPVVLRNRRLPGGAGAGSGAARRRVAVVTTEPLAAALAGPAIRAVEMARVLAATCEVTVATTATCVAAEVPVPSRAVDDDGLLSLSLSCDVLVLGGDVLARLPALADGRAALVVDLYDPFHLEQLEQARDLGEERRREMVFGAVDTLRTQLALGDVFLCASDRQRDFWLGHLALAGRLNPVTYDDDPSLSSLLRLVPFGVPSEPAVHGSQVAKGVIAGIGVDDELVLWGGGIYNWFDPETLVRAVGMLRESRPELRLLFLGGGHPNPAVPRMRAAVQAYLLADELGLLGVHVFFADGWVPYAERQGYLLESDVGVSTHHDHVETQFSFRTRLLDYFWAGLPVVTTGGDALATVVTESGAGIEVPAGDVEALAAALDKLLGDPDLRERCREASRRVAAGLTWPAVCAPLVEFCAAPRRAPDLADPTIRREIVARAGGGPRRSLARRLAGLQRLAAERGAAETARHVARRVTGRR